MKRQALIIGLGQFGMAVARAMTARNVEVLAVDIDMDRVRAASGLVTEAAAFDAMDEQALARTQPQNRDVCLCAIGDDAREASIVCTALLRQMGAPRVVARSNDDLHGRILTLVGAHQVVNPERAFGDRFANQLLHEGVGEEMPLGEGLVITEIEVPQAMEGRTLGESQLPRRYGLTVVAIKKAKTGNVAMPSAESKLESGDTIVVVSRGNSVARMMEAQ